MKFLGSCIGKILLCILCILLGVVLTLGGIVGAGYIALTTKGVVGTIDDAVEQVDMPEETRALSVLEFGETLMGYVGSLTSAGDDAPTIGELENFIGSSAISDALFNVIGVDPAKIKEATFATLGSKLTESLTLGGIADKFGIALPDMPIFKDEEFMDETPLSEAFSTLTERTIGDFVTIEDDATGILAILKDTTIGGIGDKINTVTLGEIIGITDDTSPLILAIQDLTINDLGGEKLQDCINDLKLSDILTDMDPETTNAALYAMRDLTVKDLQGENATNAINSMFLGELIPIDDGSNKALQSMQYACIDSSFVEIASTPTVHGEYALTTAKTFVYASASKDAQGNYSVYYYPEEISYDCVLDGENQPVTEGNYYKVTYTLFVEDSGFEDNAKDLYGIKFFKVFNEDGSAVKDKDNNVKISATVCVDKNDVTKIEDNRVYLDNRYHVVYKANTDYAFYNNESDTVKKGTLLLPDWTLKADSEDAVNGTMQFYDYYKIDDGVSPVRYYDMKEVKTGKNGDTAVYERKPLQGISETMDNLSLGQMVDTTGSRLLTALSDCTLGNIGTEINTLFVDQLMEIKSTDSQMLQAIRYACLQSQTVDLIKNDLVAQADIVSSTENDAVTGKCLSDYSYYYKVDNTGKITEVYVLYLDADGNEVTDAGKTKFYQTSLYQSEDESQAYYRPLMGMNDKINELEFGDVIDMGASPSQIMISLEHTKITKIGDKLNTMTLGEMTDTSTNHLLSSLSDCTLNTLGSKISDLTLEDVFEESTLSSGVLSLIDKDTRLDDISTSVATAVQNSSVAVLVATGVIGNSSFDSFADMEKEEYSAFIYNSTMTDMLGGLVDFVVKPVSALSVPPYYQINDSAIQPTEISVGGNYASVTAFMSALNALHFEQGYALKLTQNTTVAVDVTADADYLQGAEYVIPFFELSDSTYTLTFTGGTVKLGCYDDLSDIENSYSTHQAGYLYDESNGGAGSGLAHVTGMSVKSDF